MYRLNTLIEWSKSDLDKKGFFLVDNNLLIVKEIVKIIKTL